MTIGYRCPFWGQAPRADDPAEAFIEDVYRAAEGQAQSIPLTVRLSAAAAEILRFIEDPAMVRRLKEVLEGEL